MSDTPRRPDAATYRRNGVPELAALVGISKGDLPRKEYYGRWRTFRATCDTSFQEQRLARLPSYL